MWASSSTPATPSATIPPPHPPPPSPPPSPPQPPKSPYPQSSPQAEQQGKTHTLLPRTSRSGRSPAPAEQRAKRRGSPGSSRCPAAGTTGAGPKHPTHLKSQSMDPRRPSSGAASVPFSTVSAALRLQTLVWEASMDRLISGTETPRAAQEEDLCSILPRLHLHSPRGKVDEGSGPATEGSVQGEADERGIALLLLQVPGRP